MALIDNLYTDMKQTVGAYLRDGLLTNVSVVEISPSKDKVSYKRTVTGIDKSRDYIKRFIFLHDNKDYLCTLFDNSVIQARYEFRRKEEESVIELSKATLTYYPNPGLDTSSLNDLKALNDPSELEELTNIALQINDEFQFSSNYIRIDYDVDAYKEILHPCAHLHIGRNNEFRIGLDRVPFFSEFMDFIFFAYYQERWLRKTFNLDTEISLETVQFDFESYMTKKNEFRRTNSIHSMLSEHEMDHYLIKL